MWMLQQLYGKATYSYPASVMLFNPLNKALLGQKHCFFARHWTFLRFCFLMSFFRLVEKHPKCAFTCSFYYILSICAR